MRITHVRAWLQRAVDQSVGAARRVGHAMSRRMKSLGRGVDRGVGVGDDESSFGQGGSRVWVELLEEYRKKLLAIFERTYFERFPRFERFVRRLLGAGASATAPKILPPKVRPAMKLGAHQPGGRSSEDLRAQIQLGMMNAHTREAAGMRDEVARQRERGALPPSDSDPDRE